MAIMRVEIDDEFEGEIEGDFVPAVGDTFWWKSHGPYRVIHRQWNFPAEYNDVAHRVTLKVERVEKGKARVFT